METKRGRPVGVKQKRDESKYWLPEGVTLKPGQPDTYLKSTKLTFIDSQYGEFISTFTAIQEANASTHKAAVQARRASTNIEKYGATSSAANPEVRAKMVASGLSKGSYKKGAQKAKETSLTKFGTEHYSKTKAFLSSVKSTLKAKHGVENPMHIETERSYVLPNGKMVATYCRELGVTGKKTQAVFIFKHIGPAAAQEYIETDKPEMSGIEQIFSTAMGNIPLYNKRLLKNRNFRPDFVLGNVVIEIDGLNQHSEMYKPNNNYHREKRKAYIAEGYKCLQFRQDEVVSKMHIIKSIVEAKTGKLSRKVFARKTTVETLSLSHANEALSNWHLMGPARGAKALGLIFEGELVSVVTYRRTKDGGVDIVRFANTLGCSVVGGLDKLLKHIERHEHPKYIQSFVDMRYGDGESLLKIGFKLASETLGFQWTDGVRTYNRLHCRANMDERGLSEREYAKELGLYKIFDAGQAKFVRVV